MKKIISMLIAMLFIVGVGFTQEPQKPVEKKECKTEKVEKKSCEHKEKKDDKNCKKEEKSCCKKDKKSNDKELK